MATAKNPSEGAPRSGGGISPSALPARSGSRRASREIDPGLSSAGPRPHRRLPALGVAVAVTILVHLPGLLRDLHPPGLVLPEQVQRLWPGLEWLLPPPGGSASFAAGLTLLGIALAAFLVGEVAHALRLPARVGILAVALFAASPLAGAALVDAAGRGYLLATAAWLAAACAVAGRTRGSRPAGAALAALAVWWSQGAFLPVVLLIGFVPRPGTRPRRRPGPALAIAAVVLLIPVVLWPQALPELGYGYRFEAGVNSFAQPPLQPQVPFLAALFAAVGVGAEFPFLLPGRLAPEHAHWLGGLMLLGLLLLLLFASVARRAALRWAAFAVVLAAVGVVLIALTGEAPARSTAALMPAAAGLAVMAAGLLERPGKGLRGAGGLLALGLALFWGLQSQRLEGRSAGTWLEAAHRADPFSAYAAVQLAAELRASGTGDPRQPLRELLAHAGPPFVTTAYERQLALGFLRELEHAEGTAAALAWLESWLASRTPERRILFPEVSAECLRLLLELGDVDAAVSRLEADRARFQDVPGYGTAAARAILSALRARRSRGAPELEEWEARLVPLAEDLLESAAQGGDETPEALVGLAELRMRQLDLVAAVRLAEQAAALDPRAAAPHVLLARLYLGLGQQEEGLREASRAVALDPESAAARFLEGRLQASSAPLAVAAVGKMLAATREDPAAVDVEELVAGVCAAARSLCAERRSAEAEEVLEQALAVVPRRVPLLVERARIARQQGDGETASRILAGVIAEHPGAGDVRTELATLLRDDGYARLLRGDTDAALRKFREAIDLQPEGVDLEGMKAVLESHSLDGTALADATQQAREAFEEGVAQYNAGEREAALASFLTSLRLLYRNPLAHLYVGQIELEMGRAAEARQALRIALLLGDSLEIDVERGYVLLVRALLAEQETEEARALVEEYRSRHPDGEYTGALEGLLEGDS